jgi:hypothetical protein
MDTGTADLSSTCRPVNPFSAADYLLAGLVLVAGLALYLRTLAGGLLLGDGAEFQVLGSTLGLAHSTGYPTYLLLVKLVTLLPVGDLAYRANLASALFAGLTLALVYLGGRLLGGRQAAALVGPAALALAPLFWWHAVMAEVYTPATAFIALVLLLALLWRRTGSAGHLFWAGVTGGVGLGVHGMVPLIAPAVGVYILLGSLGRPGWKATWRGALGGALLGATLWLGAFWALDRHSPPSNNLLVSIRYNLDVWQIAPRDFDSSFWVRFKFVASGRMFHEVMLQTKETAVRRQWRAYAASIEDSFPALFRWLAAAGLLGLLAYPNAALARSKIAVPLWREGLLLLLAWLGLLSFVLTYQIYDIWSFYIPTYPPLAIAAAAGAGCLADLLGRLPGLTLRLPVARRLLAGVGQRLPGATAALLAGVFGLALTAWSLKPWLPALRESWQAGHIAFLRADDFRYYPYPLADPEWPRRYARQVAAAIRADDAILFTTWDLVYPLLYVLHIEQGRTGVLAYEVYTSLVDINPSEMTLDYLRANLDTRPVYVTRIFDNMRARFKFYKFPGLELYQVIGTR